MDEHLRDPWIDHLTAYNFDVLAIYKGIIARSKGRHQQFIQHLIKKCGILQSIKPQIEHYFKSLSPYLPPEQVKASLRSKFALSSHSINFLFSEYFWAQQTNCDALFQYLQRLTVHHSPPFRLKIKTRRSIYEALVFITPEMFNNFLKFGDVVTVSFSFVPLKRDGFMRSMYLVLFTGIDDNGGVVILGMGVLAGTAYQLKALLVSWFVDLVQIDKSFAIISENSPAMQDQIQRLNRNRKNKVSFFESWQYTIDKATFFFRDQMQSRTIIQLIKKALKTFNKKDITELQSRVGMLCRSKQTKMAGYLIQLQKKTMSCISVNDPCFVGFQVYASKMKLMEKIVTSQIPYCNTLGKLIMNCLKLQQNMKQRAQNRINKSPNAEQFFNKNNMLITHELLVLLKCLNFQIFKKLIYNYITAQNNCRVRESSRSCLEVDVYESTSGERDRAPEGYILQKQQKYKLKYDLRFQHWECQCNLLQWSGLPCSHLIAVIQQYKGSLFYYLNSRWLPPTFKIQKIDSMLSQTQKLLIAPSQKLFPKKQEQSFVKIKHPLKQQPHKEMYLDVDSPNQELKYSSYNIMTQKNLQLNDQQDIQVIQENIREVEQLKNEPMARNVLSNNKPIEIDLEDDEQQDKMEIEDPEKEDEDCLQIIEKPANENLAKNEICGKEQSPGLLHSDKPDSHAQPGSQIQQNLEVQPEPKNNQHQIP